MEGVSLQGVRRKTVGVYLDSQQPIAMEVPTNSS